MKKIIRQSGVALALATALWVPQRLQGVQLQQTNSSPDLTSTNQLWQQFMALQQKLDSETSAQDEQLKQLVTQMNSAPAEQKLDAIAAVVAKLAEQQLASRQGSQSTDAHIVQTLMQGMLATAGTGTNGTGTNIVSPPVNAQPTPPPTGQPTLPQIPSSR